MPTNDYLPYLQHHGILGMKWGVRRYQNPDGSLTGAGEARYEKRKKVLKRIAIGVGIAGLVIGGTAVGVHLAKTGQLQKGISAVSSTFKSKTDNLDLKPLTKHKLYGIDLANKADENTAKVEYDFWRREDAGETNFIRMTNCKVSELDSHKEIIDAGKKIFRVGYLDDVPANSKDVENIAKRTMLYVNQRSDDHARYLKLLNNEHQGGAKRTALLYETKNRIVAPSERQRMITFMTLMNNNPEFRKAVTDAPVSEVKKNLRENYAQFFTTIGGGGKARDIYFDALRKRGFDAVSDDVDRGALSKTATILLNPAKDIKLKKAKEITDSRLLRIAANMKTLE